MNDQKDTETSGIPRPSETVSPVADEKKGKKKKDKKGKKKDKKGKKGKKKK